MCFVLSFKESFYFWILLQDLKSLKDLFKDLLKNTTEPMVVVIDSLDQLRDYGAGLRGWIPEFLNDEVTMIISAIPGEQFRVIPELEVGTFPLL